MAYYITTDARDTAKTLADFAGVPLGEFVETLIRRAAARARARNAARAAG